MDELEPEGRIQMRFEMTQRGESRGIFRMRFFKEDHAALGAWGSP